MRVNRNADGTTTVNLSPDLLSVFRGALRSDIAGRGENIALVADSDTARADVLATMKLIRESVRALDAIGWDD